MKTIEELAKECGAYIETGENDEHLEALCKAYMKDRLSECEFFGFYKGKEIYDISSLLEKDK